MPPRMPLALALLLTLATAAPEPAAAALDAAQRAQLEREPGVGAGVLAALAEREEVRVLVRFAAPGLPAGPARRDAIARRADAIVRSVPEGGMRVVRRYRAVAGFAASLTADALVRLLGHPDVVGVELDRRIHAQLAESIPLVSLDVVHAQGLTGSGIRVAVLDTGALSTHADLAGAIVAEQCFCQGENGANGCCPNGLDEMSGPGSAPDDNGHGTRVTGILASRGVLAPVGAAPGVEVLSVKILDAGGVGFASDALKALDWVATQHPETSAVNMSFGGGLYPGDCDAADLTNQMLADAVATLRAQGTLSMAGSGNDGSGSGMIAPACIADVVSVGAVWDEALGSKSQFGCTDPNTQPDLVACFTNSSTTTDVMAPGAQLNAPTRSGGVSVGVSGTSYATPIVAGCAAVLEQGFPAASPGEIEAALESSTTRVVDATNGLDFPRLDCEQARAALVGTGHAVPGLGLPLACALALALALAAGRAARRLC